MKVMIIAQGYPTADAPMNGIHEMTYAQVLSQAGMDLCICAIDMRSFRHRRPWGLTIHREGNIPIYNMSLPGGRMSQWWLGHYAAYGLKKAVVRAVNEWGKPDVVHAHFFDRAFPFVLNNGRWNYPLIISEHSSRMHQSHLPRDLQRVGDATYGKADLVMVGSRRFAACMKEHFELEPMVIQTAARLDRFFYQPQISSEYFQLVAVGNLKASKGQRDILRAFIRAFGEDERTSLILVGEGEDRPTLLQMAAEANVSARVHLVGQQSQEAINDLFNQSHLFVHASHSETYGKVIVEALSAGIPVLSSLSGGADDFLHEENGRYFPVGDVDALTQAMLDMKANYHRYDRSKIAKEAESIYSEKNLAKRYQKIYEKVVATHAAT